jgi:hypothetical protein
MYAGSGGIAYCLYKYLKLLRMERNIDAFSLYLITSKFKEAVQTNTPENDEYQAKMKKE